MIKLIATDIDGTLVKDGTLIIDPEYMTVISKLIDKGIIFTVCSGRQFSSEQKLFAPIKDKLMYITDGGTVVRTPDKILKTYPMSAALWKCSIASLYFFSLIRTSPQVNWFMYVLTGSSAEIFFCIWK